MAASGLWAALSLGVLREAWPGPRPEHLALGVGWLAVFALRLTERSRRELRGRMPWTMDLELGLLALLAARGLVQASGGLSSSLHPLLYVVVATVGALGSARAAGALVLLAVALEWSIGVLSGPAPTLARLGPYATFLAFFGTSSVLLTRLEVVRARQRSRARLRGELQRVREESRLLRLAGAPASEGVHDEEGLLRASLQEVYEQVGSVLSLLRGALGLDGAAVYVLDTSGEQLHLVEACQPEGRAMRERLGAREGALGAVVRRGEPLRLHPIRAGYSGLTHYLEPPRVRAFAAVPLGDEEGQGGVLAVDRSDDRAFTDAEMATLGEAARQVLRAMRNERLFLQMERSKREQGILYRASQQLGAALDEVAVVRAAFEAAAEIAPQDLALLTFYDPKRRRHEVRYAQGPLGASLEGFSVGSNRSLLDMAVQHGHALPYRGEFDPKRQVLVSGRRDPHGLRSALVLPLAAREQVLGALVVGARHARAYGPSARATLEVLANQLAVALANVRAVQRLERMATTDGLTGCLNKRAFLETLEDRMKAAQRFGHPLALLVTDIDHFKSVNDTYGHDVGDVVIRALGDVLRKLARETDVVARFGGEEFCVLCEQTDAQGAAQLAERIRTTLQELEFPTPMGSLRVTCSIGVAQYPTQAADGPSLFKAADEALYAAKRGGRNQVRIYAGAPLRQTG